MLADGSRTGPAIMGPETAEVTVLQFAPNLAAIAVSGPGRIAPTTLARTAILRDACALSYREVAARTSVTVRAARSRYERHRALLATNPEYAETMTELVAAAMHRFVGALRPT